MNKIERILRAILYIAPLASSPDNEIFLQGVQSGVELLDLLKPRQAATPRQRLRLALRVVETWQLFFEMIEPRRNRKTLVLKIELLKFFLKLLALDATVRNNKLLISDFLKAVAPLVVAVVRSRGENVKALVLYVLLSVCSLALLEDRVEFQARTRELTSDLIWRRPIFDYTVKPPVEMVNNLLNRIPIVRDLNYLDYYVSLNNRFYYYLEGASRNNK